MRGTAGTGLGHVLPVGLGLAVALLGGQAVRKHELAAVELVGQQHLDAPGPLALQPPAPAPLTASSSAAASSMTSSGAADATNQQLK